MSSDQSNKPPSQAGRFKPRKPASRKPATAIARPANADATPKPGGEAGSSGRGNDGPLSRGQGRGRGGRGRGRFAVPKGQVFFTGSAAARAPGDNTNTASTAKTSVSSHNVTDSIANQDIVIIPGMGSSTRARGNTKASSDVGKTAQERMLASALARSGEGEEVIVGEMEEGSGVGDGKKKRGILESAPDDEFRSSIFDNDEGDHVELPADAFTYDSDSSTDGDAKRATHMLNERKRKDNRARIPLQPQQLPFPPTRKTGSDEVEYLYKCQMQSSNTDGNEGVSEFSSSDPPLRTPFINHEKATAEQRKEEQLSWMIFKLPTRLPRLIPHCTLSGKATKTEPGSHTAVASPDVIKSETDLGDLSSPDAILSSSMPDTTHATAVDQTAVGYDDTLKDAAAGRYGKIIVHKSGKAYLIVGGEDSKTPQVKMLLSEGLTCGFLQQAVVIDPNQASYTPLAEVKKTIIVTPDVESAFAL